MMSKLLAKDPPLVVQRSLAVALGLAEAMIFQQIHYWVRKSKHDIKGVKWIYNTYSQWQEQFPFFSEKTLKRAIRALEKKGLIISGYYHEDRRNRTKWYTIDYSSFEVFGKQVVPPIEMNSSNESSGADGGGLVSADGGISKSAPPLLTENSSESSTKSTTDTNICLIAAATCSSQSITEKEKSPLQEHCQTSFTKSELGENYRSRWNTFVAYANEQYYATLLPQKILSQRIIDGVWARHTTPKFDFALICDKIVNSQYLLGLTTEEDGTKPYWKGATFHFIFGNDDNWTKIVNGNYDDRY